MLTRRIFMSAIAAAALWSGAAQAEATRTKVVVSFSILGDLVARVGGDDIEMRVLVGPNGDAHIYRPTPEDAAAIADADLLIMNGLGYEGWFERLPESAGFSGAVIVASEGVTPRTSDGAHSSHSSHAGDHGEVDPHAWQDIGCAKIYVSNIAKALSDADPASIEDYKARAAILIAEMDALDAHARATFAAIPEARRVVITNHDAFGYFADAYGLRFLTATGLSTDAEPTPNAVATLIDQIKSEGAAAIFLENLSDNRLMERISEETGAVIGGTLYSDSLSGPDGPATSYLELFAHNVDVLSASMREKVN